MICFSEDREFLHLHWPGDGCEGGGGETHHHVAHRHVHHEQRHARVQDRVPGHRRDGELDFLITKLS